MNEAEDTNYQIFRDCVATPLIEKSTEPAKKKPRANGRRKTAIKPVAQNEECNDAAELAEFVDYIASEIFSNLPDELRSLTYTTWLNTPALQTRIHTSLSPMEVAKILDPLSPTITESLTTYSFLPPHTTLTEYLTAPFLLYLTTVLTPPPPPRLTKMTATSCEICDREWIPLTYHHLIPRAVHEKVLKRGWHTEDQLNNVAWLCRACHSFIHRVASNEELAKDWYTVERLWGRDDVRGFAEWVGKVRWKKS